MTQWQRAKNKFVSPGAWCRQQDGDSTVFAHSTEIRDNFRHLFHCYLLMRDNSTSYTIASLLLIVLVYVVHSDVCCTFTVCMYSLYLFFLFSTVLHVLFI